MRNDMHITLTCVEKQFKVIYLINCTDRVLIVLLFVVGPLNIAKLAYFRGLIVQLELVLIILIIELRVVKHRLS